MKALLSPENQPVTGNNTAMAKSSNIRELLNPEIRLPLPDDFPNALEIYPQHGYGRNEKDAHDPSIGMNATAICSLVEERLQKLGLRPQDVERINIAYPHKHPERRKKKADLAQPFAVGVRKVLRERMPHIDFVMADCIYDTVHLGHSEDPSCKQMLERRQIYALDPGLQEDAFPFIDNTPPERELFVIVDDIVDRGTTLAGLISFISYNGGIVLGAMTRLARESSGVAQKQSSAKTAFGKTAYNRGRIPDIGKAFENSARKDGLFYTAEQCLDIFESYLNRFGNSLQSLTNGECNRIVEAVDASSYEDRWSFRRIQRSHKTAWLPTAIRRFIP